jgi:hypothetical protein
MRLNWRDVSVQSRRKISIAQFYLSEAELGRGVHHIGVVLVSPGAGRELRRGEL